MIERFFVGTAQAMAGGPAPQAGQRGASGGPQQMWSTLFVLGSFILIFYFLLIRPQQKRQKEQQKLISALEKGDKVITSGGVHGVISNVKDDTVMVKVAENVKLEISRSSITKVEKGSADEGKTQ